MLNKNKIKANFSKSAPVYEEHAYLQKKLADELFSKIEKIELSRILDIGCGAGYLTHLVANKFPQAEVVGIDIAKGMIEAAEKKPQLKNLRFFVADGESFNFEPNSLDLIISNLSFQWMDHHKTVEQVKRVLRPGGKFLFHTFGPQTLNEIRQLGFRVNIFPSLKDWEKILVENFALRYLDSKTSFQEFGSLKDAMAYLKQIGAQGIDESAQISFAKIRQNFQQKKSGHAKIILSFEVIFGEVVKK